MRDGQKRVFRQEGYDVARWELRRAILRYMKGEPKDGPVEKALLYLAEYIGNFMTEYLGDDFASAQKRLKRAASRESPRDRLAESALPQR